MCTKCARTAPAGFASTAKTLANIGAPGRNRTCDARFRKPTLYPLSYGGGDGAKRGAKLRCWVRPHVRQRLSACFEARGGLW